MAERLRRVGLCAALIALAPGCARNAIVLDRATEMGTAGRAATAGTADALDVLRATNRAVLVDLVTLDPRCALPRPVIAAGPGGDGSVLCRAGQIRQSDFEISRWSARELRPSLAVLNGMAAYLGTIDAVITRKPVDIAADVADAEAKLRVLAGDLNVLVGMPVPPELSADQQKAIQGTLALLSEILDEARRVRDLRRIELDTDPQAFNRSLAALAAVNEATVDRLNGQLSNQRNVLSVQLRRMTDDKLELRRPVVERQFDTIEAQEALPELRHALRVSVAAFDKAHAEYRDLLLGVGKLTENERRKAARIAQARVLGALHNLASIIKTF